MTELWSRHRVDVYGLMDISVDGDADGLDVSRVALVVPGYVHPVDIGSWCYTRRRAYGGDAISGSVAERKVLKSSFRSQRSSVIEGFIAFLQGHISLGKSENTIKGYVAQFEFFVSWCDRCYPEGLDGRSEFVNAMSGYSESLIEKVKFSQLNMNAAATYQLVAMQVGRFIYQDPYSDLFRGVRRIRRSLAAVVKTKVPDEDVAGDALKAYLEIFHQLSQLIINSEKFPKKITIGSEYFWFFPSSLPIAGPSTVSNKPALKIRYLCYDYIDGRIRTADEYRKLAANPSRKVAIASIRRAKKVIEDGNSNLYHRSRVFAATFAVEVFMMIFTACTGMNLGQVASIKWEEEYDLTRDRLGFRGVKRRAGNKDVMFYLSAGMLPLFKIFLRVREYLVGGLRCGDVPPYLFFYVSGGEARQVGPNFSTHLHARMQNCFDLDFNISPRMWRAFKADWLLSNVSLKTSVKLLQNNSVTMTRHYAEGLETKAEKELSRFFCSYKDEIILSRSDVDVPLSVGHCQSMNPSSLVGAEIAPDCKQEEGCLFCDKYRAHLDRDDFKKLVSFKYILEISRPLAMHDEHFNKRTSGVISRVDEILSLMVCNSAELKVFQDEIYREVYEYEDLSTYWSMKLKLLDEVGMGL